MATVEALAAAVDAKDPYTQGHSQRVSRYAAALADALDLPAADVARIHLAGQLHDVGKIGVPDAVLAKPGKLSPDEYQAIQQHPVIGERMLAGVPFLQEILPAVRHHHERWDGQGYPDGLCGLHIPQDAAILAVADSFDAMTSSRPYRSALPLAEARRRILEGSGTQFDPQMVRAFEQAMAEGSIVVPAISWPDVLHEVVEQAS
jgi:HD-GYP domain-containing protein (c-di-GMP phosphodiesterase class II)